MGGLGCPAAQSLLIIGVGNLNLLTTGIQDINTNLFNNAANNETVSTYNNILWNEPNDHFLHHELIEIDEQYYMGIIETQQLGPIPIGNWTNSGFQWALQNLFQQKSPRNYICR